MLEEPPGYLVMVRIFVSQGHQRLTHDTLSQKLYLIEEEFFVSAILTGHHDDRVVRLRCLHLKLEVVKPVLLIYNQIYFIPDF